MKEKIAFITCVNDESVYNEALLYLRHLLLPEDMQAEYIPIYDAVSMTAGYNQALHSSKAKYKVYLHQDAFLIYPETVRECLRIFMEHPEIGMIGLAGCKKLPKNGIWWQGDETYGIVAHALEPESLQVTAYGRGVGDFQTVQAIDGVFMATQYDIPWREDLFTAWHFYDISQSMEFARQGYEVIVPQQEEPWCVHACGRKELGDYDKWRQIFLQEYRQRKTVSSRGAFADDVSSR